MEKLIQESKGRDLAHKGNIGNRLSTIKQGFESFPLELRLNPKLIETLIKMF